MRRPESCFGSNDFSTCEVRWRVKAGVQLIVAYKFARAVAAAVAALALCVVDPSTLSTFVDTLHAHLTSHLALLVSSAVTSALAPPHLALVAGALGLDAVVCFVEGWSLWKEKRWGPWFVAAAATVLVPFEVTAIVQHVSAVRVIALLLNVAIVIYLFMRAKR